MTGRFLLGAIAAVFLCFCVAQPSALAGEETLIETIRQIKPSIVGIGIRSPLDRPVNQLIGTGFVVADGQHAITNLHVVNERVTPGEGRTLAVFVGTGENVEARPAKIVAKDEAHDVAILAFEGKKLPAMRLGGDKIVDEGMNVAFTGFPIGAVYGLHPVTHRGMVSAVTPIAIPQISSRTLNTDMIRRLQDRFNVFQLDATAYPGNSGSPVYDPQTGDVIAIISSVFVKESRENVLSKPSGITFAIPIQYALRLLHSQDIESP